MFFFMLNLFFFSFFFRYFKGADLLCLDLSFYLFYPNCQFHIVFERFYGILTFNLFKSVYFLFIWYFLLFWHWFFLKFYAHWHFSVESTSKNIPFEGEQFRNKINLKIFTMAKNIEDLYRFKSLIKTRVLLRS